MDAARVYRVGRDPENDIVIEHGSVSRAHCELKVLDDGAILLADLGSMNGTAVRQNGQWEHIEQATVERDERILLGEIVTTVAALLVRAPQTSEREEKARLVARSRTFFGGVDAELPAKPRRIPKPTEPAKPDANPSSGILSRLIQSDWARLHRRSSERKPRRDEPSICLPAIVGPANVDLSDKAADRPGREPPSLRSQRSPTVPVAGFGAAPSLALATDAAASADPKPVDFAALAQSPLLATPPSPMPGAPPDAVPAPARQEPALFIGPVPKHEASDVKPPFGPRKRKHARWVPPLNSPAFAKWAVVASAVLLTSGGAVAAYFKYGPESAPATTMAAVTNPVAPGSPQPGATDERAPGDPPRAAPPKSGEERKPLEKRAEAAAPARTRAWQQSIDGTPESAIHGASAARDGLCLAGITSLAAGGQEAWVLRLDAQGAVRWQRRPGGPGRDAALAVAASSDGGCVAAGYDSDETRLWIFKIDAAGVLAWNRSVPTGHSGRAVAIQRLRDGGFAVAAHGKPAADRADRAFVMRLSPKGDIKWSKYAGKGESLPTDLRETMDGGVIVAGMARDGQSRLALWAARLDRDGRTRWEEHYGGPGTPTGARIEVARGKEYIIAATMTGVAPAAGEKPGPALRLVRIHDDGEVIWDRRHAGPARRVAGLVLGRGGIFVAGDSGTGAVAPEIWVAQFDATGRSQRENRLPAAAADRAAALAEMADGRLVLAGTAEIEGSGRRGAGLLYLDRSGHLVAER